MKNDIIRTVAGIALLATAAGIAYKLFRRSTEGTVARMKAPFVGQIFPYPITSDVVSSPFGVQRPTGPHLGIDLKTRFAADGKTPDPRGKPGIGIVVKSPFDGVVTSVFTNAGGGLQMEVQAKDGTIMGLAHLLTAQVAKGDIVEVGDVLAGTGQSGNVTGPHLHLTVRDPSGKAVDPAPYLGL